VNERKDCVYRISRLGSFCRSLRPPLRVGIPCDEMARDIRRPARQAASQGRSHYLEPDTDDDFEMEDVYAPETTTVRAPPLKRRRRSNTGRQSVYTEPDTDDEFEAAHESSQRRSVRRTQPSVDRLKRVSATSKATSKARSRDRGHNRSRNSNTRSVQPLGRPRRINSQALPEQKSRVFSGPSDNRIPPWASLPVEILKDIFVFAVARENKYLRSSEARCVC
jgi:hypothetical protein